MEAGEVSLLVLLLPLQVSECVKGKTAGLSVLLLRKMELEVLKTNKGKQGKKKEALRYFFVLPRQRGHTTLNFSMFSTLKTDLKKKMSLSMYVESDIGQETEEREGDYRGRKWSRCRLSADSIARQEIQRPK